MSATEVTPKPVVGQSLTYDGRRAVVRKAGSVRHPEIITIDVEGRMGVTLSARNSKIGWA